ncbi:hypothetical protein N7488_005070 [Penicillium malachiteum]|nr:hypothetical protein N7488_005070 [Penicillium malachiteum]
MEAAYDEAGIEVDKKMDEKVDAVGCVLTSEREPELNIPVNTSEEETAGFPFAMDELPRALL